MQAIRDRDPAADGNRKDDAILEAKKGIVTDMEHCYVCGKPYPEIHHCIFGTANRKKSDKYNLLMPLCYEHHRGNTSPHQCKTIDLLCRRMAQRYFEQNCGTHEEFMEEFGKNYL